MDVQERSPPIELESGNKTRAVAFSANGEYLVSGDEKKVRVWRVEDGKQMATMTAGLVNCLAVSKDGRLIAAGTFSGEMVVWDTLRAYKKVFALEDHYVIGLDFSPGDSPTQLLTASFKCTATIWDIVNGERALTLRHDEEIVAAKYSPQGDRIAVATDKFIRVYDTDGGRLLVDIRAEVTPWYNTGLLWSNDRRFFIVSENKIKQIDVSTGSTVSEWPVPDSDASTCIALQQHGEFLAYSANRTVTIWDTYDTHTQLDLIQHSQIIRSIAISRDDRFLAIAGERGKFTIRRLPRSLIDLIPLSRLHPTFEEPDIQIDDAALQSWKQGQLANAEALLTAAAMHTSLNASHHILASRALIRTRLGDWDAAIVDAKESIKIQPSVIGYIAKGVAHVGKGEKQEGYRACDIAFERYHSNHVSFLLLIKAVIVFMAGEHDDAISRLDDLIATVRSNSICYVVQAKMYLLLGNMYMTHNNYEDAIRSFEHALAKVRRHTSLPLLAVSLISGWIFDTLDITIRQCLCEAMFAAGRTKDAGESLLKLVNIVEKEVYMIGPTTEWIYDFMQRCLSTPERDGDVASNTTQYGNPPMPHSIPNSSTHTPILREWTKAKLTPNAWQDVLVASAGFLIPRFDIYKTVCEHLEAADRVLDATECIHQMVSESTVGAHMQDEQAKWVADFKLRCAEKLEHLGDTAMTTRDYDEAISKYSAALTLDPEVPQGLFIKRSKAYIAGGVCEQALNDADEVIMLDPSSPWGYERKHAALHKAGSYDDAIGTFKTMLSKMSESRDLDIRACCQQYVDPAETREAIREAIQNAIRALPRVLINTDSGCLLGKSKQALSFESLPVYKELISSMTTHIDHGHIEQEVTDHYRYATFSHTWKITSLCSKKSYGSWCTTSRSIPLMTSSKCSARLCGTPGSIGHGAIHVVSTKVIMSCSRRL
ncbi:hypothetical protein JVT61DRAFT_3383 [Boletus reticuloceps]|uniref:Uncharacterized protein n=1 Tax=Boletus reticuloceps TaxID=495285 RepID=A0A8I2YN76_9AGAM|nr:hypothetical protein JVT61DRAFT_3383 [Boletus reticuloceps]